MSYDDGMRPSQQALAELFCHEVEQSHDMKLMDSLVPALVGDYGETHHAIYAYETEDYPLLRQRDLFILQTISAALPAMRDPRFCGTALTSVISHMNTIEGQQALYDLVETKFHNSVMSAPLGEYLEGITDVQRTRWATKFNHPAAIDPAEYAADRIIASSRPLPDISPDFMARLGIGQP